MKLMWINIQTPKINEWLKPNTIPAEIFKRCQCQSNYGHTKMILIIYKTFRLLFFPHWKHLKYFQIYIPKFFKG